MEQNITVYFMNNESVHYNNSDASRNGTLNLIYLYKLADKELFLKYKVAAINIGLLVVLCNLIVVVSSGLILRKGQQPKNTYILLGNVSLADTMVGFFLIISALGGQTLTSSTICVFKTGMIVCPAIISLFSVALIAIDRYCYILHGLYYHRYFTTRRVRIGISVTWIIGLTLGFLPAFGLVNQNVDADATCSYLTLFPDYLILLNTFLSIAALMLIAFLYCIILINALRNIKNIKASRIPTQHKKDSKDHLSTITIHRGRVSESNPKVLDQQNNYSPELKKSSSFSSSRDFHNVFWNNVNVKSKSINDLLKDVQNFKPNFIDNTQRVSNTDSDYSITSIDLSSSYGQSTSSIDVTNKRRIYKVCKSIKENIKIKRKEPCKMRAVVVLTLTSGSIIITWLPFFIAVILFVLCENKKCNYQCFRYKLMLGPFLTLAFMNSLLNPLIYAWWHKGFKRSIKNYYRRYILKKMNHKNLACT